MFFKAFLYCNYSYFYYTDCRCEWVRGEMLGMSTILLTFDKASTYLVTSSWYKPFLRYGDLFKFSIAWGCVSLPRSTTSSDWKLPTLVLLETKHFRILVFEQSFHSQNQSFYVQIKPINPCPAELLQLYFSSFEAGIADAISSFKWRKILLFMKNRHV